MTNSNSLGSNLSSHEADVLPSKPPVAKARPKALVTHGDQRVDPYYWLSDRDDAEVIDYLKAENAYTAAQMQHTEALQQTLYDEMLGRIQESDLSVPYRYGGYYYYSRTEAGRAYSIHCRKQGSLEATEEVLLDENVLAEGHEFFSLGSYEVSPDHSILAYATDTQGDERYSLAFKSLEKPLETDSNLAESISNTGGVAWVNDNKTLFYLSLDEANRPFQLWRHRLGTSPDRDQLVYEEKDEAFYLDLGVTLSEAYILLSAESKITSEVRFLDANTPEAAFRVIHPREKGVEYSVSHHPGTSVEESRFYIVTNDEAINFKLMMAPVVDPSKGEWQTVIEHRADVMLVDADVFADHLVIYERSQGLPTIRIQTLSTGEIKQIDFPEPTYFVTDGFMREFSSHVLRFRYSSMVTPLSVFDYDMNSHERELKKQQPVLGGYDPNQYASEWLVATAKDGTQVPISLVYKKDTPLNRRNPLHLTGYGSYGYPYPVTFSTYRLSLLNRGVVCAIAHIRGGGEMGRQWYEDGKFLHKTNTFTDFIACAEHLIEQGWTSAEQLAISGGSAGGLLMGAVVNQRPDLFKVAIAQVPFVDVLTTILDPDLPLSVMEWDEWGNPNEPEFYEYMKAYSPYDNVTQQDYPNLLITGGLNDPRVSYWEPAKWTAKLRATKTDNNQLLLKTNMGAGHGGASGRYERIKEIAFVDAFLLDYLGVSEA
ncbi:MAG: S9 family peptidase [Phormidesmis sp.]